MRHFIFEQGPLLGNLTVCMCVLWDGLTFVLSTDCWDWLQLPSKLPPTIIPPKKKKKISGWIQTGEEDQITFTNDPWKSLPASGKSTEALTLYCLLLTVFMNCLLCCWNKIYMCAHRSYNGLWFIKVASLWVCPFSFSNVHVFVHIPVKTSPEVNICISWTL